MEKDPALLYVRFQLQYLVSYILYRPLVNFCSFYLSTSSYDILSRTSLESTVPKYGVSSALISLVLSHLLSVFLEFLFLICWWHLFCFQHHYVYFSNISFLLFHWDFFFFWGKRIRHVFSVCLLKGWFSLFFIKIGFLILKSFITLWR